MGGGEWLETRGSRDSHDYTARRGIPQLKRTKDGAGASETIKIYCHLWTQKIHGIFHVQASYISIP